MAFSEDCEYCFISPQGEFSENQSKTKDLNEKLNNYTELSHFLLIRSKVVTSVRVKRQFCNHFNFAINDFN